MAFANQLLQGARQLIQNNINQQPAAPINQPGSPLMPANPGQTTIPQQFSNQQIVDYTQGMTPQQIYAASQQFGVAPGQLDTALGYAPGTAQNWINQNITPGGGMIYQSTPQTAPPPTGLIGAEQATMQGLTGALQGLEIGLQTGRSDLQQAQQTGLQQLSGGDPQGQLAQARAAIQQGANPLEWTYPMAGGAYTAQAALSGAMGPQQQQQAFSEFQSSPGQQYLQQQGEQALLRNQAAIGGLGGGNVRQELMRQGIGMAAQDFGNQFNRLGQVAGTGLQAAQSAAQLRGAEAGLIGDFAGQESSRRMAGASLTGQIGQSLANLGQTGGLTAAQLASQAGSEMAGRRFDVGQMLASNIGGTSSALSNLAQQQGAGVSDLLGATGGNLANLLSGTGAQLGGTQQALATLLANIATQSGSQVAGLPGIPGVQDGPDVLGGAGQLLSGIGGAYNVFGA